MKNRKKPVDRKILKIYKSLLKVEGGSGKGGICSPGEKDRFGREGKNGLI